MLIARILRVVYLGIITLMKTVNQRVRCLVRGLQIVQLNIYQMIILTPTTQGKKQLAREVRLVRCRRHRFPAMNLAGSAVRIQIGGSSAAPVLVESVEARSAGYAREGRLIVA